MLIRGEFQNTFLEAINYGKEWSYRGHIALDQVKVKDKVVIYRGRHWMLYRAPPLQGPSEPIPPGMHRDLRKDLRCPPPPPPPLVTLTSARLLGTEELPIQLEEMSGDHGTGVQYTIQFKQNYAFNSLFWVPTSEMIPFVEKSATLTQTDTLSHKLYFKHVISGKVFHSVPVHALSTYLPHFNLENKKIPCS